MSSFGVSFNVEKFIKAKIMELADPATPKNMKFTAEFENAVESIQSESNDISDVFRVVALSYANESGVNLTRIEMDYASDLYMGINPWTKSSSGANL
jgi:hypothetical protein